MIAGAFGCREGRTATKPWSKDLTDDQIVDQLAAVAFSTGQSQQEIRRLVEIERGAPALYTPQPQTA